MDEVWKQIIEYPNYSISNLGVVRNDKTEKILKNNIGNHGYYCVDLSKNGIKKTFLVHRLIGQYFIEGFDVNLEIDHIDRIRSNNDILNLRCVTRSENTRNKNKHSNSSSKYKGVSFDKKSGKWRARVREDKGKHIHLGHFNTEEEAHQKYLEWNKDRGYLV
jgi:hypothetical protein